MKTSATRIFLAAIAVALIVLAVRPAPPVYAVNKDMVQLQTQVQQLSEAVARLQLSHDKDMGMLTELLRQTSEAINKMNANMADVQKRVQGVSEAQNGKSEQLSGQIQSMNDSIDEMKTRLNQFDKILGNIQGQQQSMAANIQSLATAATPPATGMPGDGAPGMMPTTPAAGTPPPAPINTPATSRAAAPIGITAKDLYGTAYADYNSGKYGVAEAEFADVIRYYPNSELAGSANYYLGEIDFRANRYASAVTFYDKVLEISTDNTKIRSAHLHKGDSLAKLKQTVAAEREYRALINRFPGTQEAHLAQQRLATRGSR